MVSRNEDAAWLSLRNVVEVHLVTPDQLNTYDVLVNDDVVFTSSALEAFLVNSGQYATPTSEEDAK